MRTILVEGESDKAAVEVIAQRLGVEVNVVATGGITNFGRHLGSAVGGLYDKPEARQLAGARGVAACDLEEVGFFASDGDLEDELLRAVGVAAVLDLVESEGDLGRFRTMQQQPEWRNQPVHKQLRRWFGAGAGRKIRYARLLAEQLDLAALPQPLARLMAYVTA